MLMDKKDVLELFRCPKFGGKLEFDQNQLVATHEGGKIEYEMINGCPILIDYDNSVLGSGNVKSVIPVTKRYTYGSLLGFAKRLVSPPKETTRNNVKYIMDSLLNGRLAARVLIVGGGTIGQNMEPFYQDPRIELVSFDIYSSPNVQFVADAHRIPLPDNSFDAVIIQAVLEHVLDPAKVVAEIHRVLKGDAIVYAETPFLQHVHEGPYDFTRFTESGHRYLFRRFHLIDSGASGGAGTQLIWSLDNFFRGLFRSKAVGKLVKLGFFWLQYCDKLIPESYNVDSASGVFFLGRKQQLEISAIEIVAHYKGAQ